MGMHFYTLGRDMINAILSHLTDPTDKSSYVCGTSSSFFKHEYLVSSRILDLLDAKQSLGIKGNTESVKFLGDTKNNVDSFMILCATGSLANLEVLNLYNNKIGDDGMKEFAKAIARGSLAKLESLNFSHNQIGDEGMKVFASAIASGSLANLTHLYLNMNMIGDAGMTAFARAMGALGSLTALYLGHNQIGDVGMIALADAIAALHPRRVRIF
tara:strand:- start:206 stop:847 length:642 start_codon:yes stop_codon:yes gene_type:complete